MAEALKNHFGAEVPRRIAAMIRAVHPRFETAAFVADALDGYAPLSLMQRGPKVAAALRRHLPGPYPEAIDILLASLGPKLEGTAGQGMAPFLYLPHTCFVAAYGLDDFEVSMQAQYELTQRFTAEFSLRPFLERYPEATLERLAVWATDPSPHVRRLVSEGTRPRLPWAPRLRAFADDPRPVLALLERLKDDPDPYVRRSVANHLNDLGKDHPDLVAATLRRWLQDASEERRRLVRHALRSALKRAEPGALALLGFGRSAAVTVGKVRLAPRRVSSGGAVTIAFEVSNTGARRQRVLVDCRVHFVKASGAVRPKVFKLKVVELAPGEAVALAKTISLAELTTRRHYPGEHTVDVVLNGRPQALGSFLLTD